jgi:hypothetical protein
VDRAAEAAVRHPPVLRRPEVLPQPAVFPQLAARRRAESFLQQEVFPERPGAERFAATERRPAGHRAEALSRHRQPAARPEPASPAGRVWASATDHPLRWAADHREAGHQADPSEWKTEAEAGEPPEPKLRELQSAEEAAAACARPEAVRQLEAAYASVQRSAASAEVLPPAAECESAQPKAAAPSAWQAEAGAAVQPWALAEAAAVQPASGAEAEEAVLPAGEAAVAEPRAAAAEQQREEAAARPASAAELRQVAVRGRGARRAAARRASACPCPWDPVAAPARRRSVGPAFGTSGLAPVTARLRIASP